MARLRRNGQLSGWQPSFQLGLFKPGPPIHDKAIAQTLFEVLAKGAMPPLVLSVRLPRRLMEISCG